MWVLRESVIERKDEVIIIIKTCGSTGKPGQGKLDVGDESESD